MSYIPRKQLKNNELNSYLETYFPHLTFQKDYFFTAKTLRSLGECETAIKVISTLPIQPERRDKLLWISLKKGAQSTTAIEGNTLTLDEIEKITSGKPIAESKAYQKVEIQNVVDALQNRINEVIYQEKFELITPELLKKFHYEIGKNLNQHLDGEPGEFRSKNVWVSNYIPPDWVYVEELIKELCDWLQEDFHFEKGQEFHEYTIEAIISHLYIAWIHPFGDGNGRTARLLENYILLRGGVPIVVSYLLSNFYNDTKPEYYRQLHLATKEKSASGFIEYAIQGFRDGLYNILDQYFENLLDIAWQKYIYDTFSQIKYRNITFKRKRDLILNMPTDRFYSVEELIESNTKIIKWYANKSGKTIQRDLKELQNLKLIIKKDKSYKANIEVLQDMVIPKKQS